MLRRATAAAFLLAFTVLPANAARSWFLIRGRNVIVIGQQSPRALRRVAVELEQFRFALSGMIRGAREPLSMPTLFYAFDDRKTMEPFLPLYQGKPAAIAGYCQCGSSRDASFIVADLGNYGDSTHVIFHEYTHLLVRHALSIVPIWVNEGLAEYYSTFHLRNDETADLGNPLPYHLHLLRARFIPVGDLVAVTTASALYNESDRRSVFYAESWALTHYLINERPNGAAALNKYVNAVQSRIREQEAFVAAFGVTAAQMTKELQAYVRRPAFAGLTYKFADRVEIDEPEKARTLDPSEAEARLGSIQLQIGRANEAAERIEAAAAQAPGLSETQLSLALLRLNQRRVDEASAPLAKAAELAPEDFSTQYLYGLTLIRDAMNGAKDANGSERAYGALTRAIQANPQAADALAWRAFLGLSTLERLDEARMDITRAIELAPGRPEFRLRLAEIDLRMNKEAEARTLLRVLATSSDEAVASRAKGYLDRLERRTSAPAAARPQAPSRGVDVPDVNGGRSRSGTTAIPMLRMVKPGEERVLGRLVDVGCSSAGVRFMVQDGDRVVVAAAKRMEDVDLASFGDKEMTLACGRRTPPDLVYLTWIDESTASGSAPVKRAVALEFLPPGYAP